MIRLKESVNSDREVCGSGTMDGSAYLKKVATFCKDEAISCSPFVFILL